MVINEVARIEVPAQSRAIIQHYAGIDDMKFAVRRLQSRRDIQQMRLERLMREELPESVGFVRLYVAFEPLALDLILARYDEATDLMILGADDVGHGFESLDLRLTERCMYLAIIAAKPAFVDYHGTRYAVDRKLFDYRIEEYTSDSPLHDDPHRTTIELQRAGLQLPSTGLMPFDEQLVRFSAKKLHASIERLEYQRIVE